jgi:hypothetical protein
MANEIRAGNKAPIVSTIPGKRGLKFIAHLLDAFPEGIR